MDGFRVDVKNWLSTLTRRAYSASFAWDNIDDFVFDRKQLTNMKKTCQKHCFSTLNHNLAYRYNDARVIKMDVGEREARIPRRRP